MKAERSADGHAPSDSEPVIVAGRGLYINKYASDTEILILNLAVSIS